MISVNQHVGSRIRLYRQMKRYTLAELAEKIHKSKATLSKYETGDIAVDVETLFEIAEALRVRPMQLLDYDAEPQMKERVPDGFFPEKRIYLYFFDGRKRKVRCSLLDISREGAPASASLYYDVKDLSQPESCRNLYFGTAEFFDTVTQFSLDSQSSRVEKLTLCAANPFDRSGQVLGMLTGLSRYPMLPVSIKCILSDTPLQDNETLRESLILSRSDFKLIRTLNMFAVEQLR
ncbi:MAG: helix-turn-helix transcriptional regulator [Lachnospiraceae bacterium]|nr:helix-turn-helix transcriptional regulator [Lachnospiraceae bacterium]MBQ7600665.1 helix-turn-helix transcriptional regulator [Lachnospiraceae bacterium]